MLPENKTFKRSLKIDFKAMITTTAFNLLPAVAFYRGIHSVSVDFHLFCFAVQFDFYLQR